MSNCVYSIQHIPEQDRPRERLLRHGAESLSSAELIAIILGSGTKTTPILQLAQEIISRFGTIKRLAEATIEELCEIKGIGPAKAIQLRASLALGLRATHGVIPLKMRIHNPSDVYEILREELEHEKRELFVTIHIDVRGYVINHQIVSIGTLSSAQVHPREVFYPAIRHKAASIVLAHNHPSGDPTPSKEDFEITQILIDAGVLMGIPVNDHIIIAESGYVSLREKGIKF
jgi:DNA repair protein RadC